MAETSTHDVTRLLAAWRAGDDKALDRLIPLVQDELTRIARHYMGRERSDHTLQTTALVNEAYLRLVNQEGMNWQSRAHFFAASAQIMRHILVDHARTRKYNKRGGGAVKVSFDEAVMVAQARAPELIALDEALTHLARMFPRKAQVVELRYFGGLSIEETAEVLSISDATVRREWNSAKAWLYQSLTPSA
jgi:RNA polymerase sigma factor (TIGR02999 family)